MCALAFILVLVSAAASTSSASAPRVDLLTSPQAGLVPLPSQDPFYAVPANIAQLPNGTVLASRRVQAMALAVPIPANAWQVQYKTIDQHGQPSAFVTTILVPQTPWQGPGARPLLSYQAAEDALSSKCAPSYVLRAGLGAAATGGPTVPGSNPESETGNIFQAVQRGFAVAVPDFEGPDSEWIPDNGAARGVLDGIRAVRNFAPAGIAQSARIALVGYSGGALATDWAIQMQPSYAPELRFAGAALGGTPASLVSAFAYFAANQGAKAAIPLLLAALERSYPEWNIGQYLNAAGRAAVTNSQNDCLLDSLIRNAGVDPTSYEAYQGAIFDNSHLDRMLTGMSPLGYPGVPHAPILFYHSTNDELASIAQMRQLAARYCAEGVPVHIVTSPAGDHIAYVITGFPTALNYVADRFAGTPAPNDCTAPSRPPTAVAPRTGCPIATGHLSALALGPVRLGVSRAQTRRALPRLSTRGQRAMDFFCLKPSGIRAGYPTPALLKTVPAGERHRLKGAVVLALTANHRYTLKSVPVGARLSTVGRRLRISSPFRVGLNRWYLVPDGHGTGVLKVRNGVIEEVGIAEASLTRTRHAARVFLESFS